MLSAAETLGRPQGWTSQEHLVADIVLMETMSEDRVVGPGKRGENAFISVSRKYPVGSRVRGRVAAVVESGFLIEIEEGVRGLIAFSDPSVAKVVNPAKVLEVGDEVEAIVSELDMDQRRLSLSLRRINP